VSLENICVTATVVGHVNPSVDARPGGQPSRSEQYRRLTADSLWPIRRLPAEQMPPGVGNSNPW
jgi:hypothetical protein